MSAYYPTHSPRPQPQVSIPSFPEPQRTSSQRQSYPAEPPPSVPDWTQYAEAANAQLDQHGNYNSGYGGYDGYGGGYDEVTPSARRNANNEFLTPNPYSPTSSGSSYYPSGNAYQQAGPSYSRTNGYEDSYRPEASSIHRTMSYPDDHRSPISSSYDPGGASFSFPEPSIQRSTSTQGYPSSMRMQHRMTNSDVGPAVQLQRHSSHASYAPSLQMNVSTAIRNPLGFLS